MQLRIGKVTLTVQDRATWRRISRALAVVLPLSMSIGSAAWLLTEWRSPG
jgi:hypothetical protein